MNILMRVQDEIARLDSITSYEEAAAYISAIPKFGGKNCMEYTKMFLEHLGNPATTKRIIHVAGTNGKGSVCAYLCSVFREAGLKSAMFISPHLVTMRERFVIEGEMISENEFLWAFRAVAAGLKTMPRELLEHEYHPSFFEYLFFMAMVLFEKADTEYIVLETGLGGRLDATNSVPTKCATVITSIGFDHMEYLGDTLEQIAGEKAGIIGAGCPVIYSNKNAAVSSVITSCAEKKGSQVYSVEEGEIKEITILNKRIDFSLQLHYYSYVGFSVTSSAFYQVENASLAAKTLDVIADERISRTHLQDGIRHAFWEGRMEEILPSVYVDGAHNSDGIEAFLKTVGLMNCKGKRKLLFSVVKDKQFDAVIEAIAKSGLFDEIGMVALQDARALQVDKIEEVFRQYTGFAREVYNSLEEAFEKLVYNRNDEDIVYIVGSLYLVGEVKALLRRPRHD